MVDLALVEHQPDRLVGLASTDGMLADAVTPEAELGSSSISTSARIQLIVGSVPGKSIPAAVRTRLRPPSQPTT
jgi:hypothetical protein